MPNYTPNLNLKKPLQTDNYNIDDANGNMDIIDTKVKEVQDLVYKYQDPVVVGNLIKLKNSGNSDRLYFKLSADVSGASILISTDDGVTSKPLKEVDGTTITSLETGFVEVVADATFFTLRNRGISAKDKKALIDVVNSGLLNESSLKTEIINALNLVNIYGEKIPTSGLWTDVLVGIPKVNTGKRWKQGSVTSSGAITQATNTNNIVLNGYSVTVNDLDFTPETIFIFDNVNNAIRPFMYKRSGLFMQSSKPVVYSKLDNTSGDDGYFEQPSLSVSPNGFSLVTNRANYLWSYIAYE